MRQIFELLVFAGVLAVLILVSQRVSERQEEKIESRRETWIEPIAEMDRLSEQIEILQGERDAVALLQVQNPGTSVLRRQVETLRRDGTAEDRALIRYWWKRRVFPLTREQLADCRKKVGDIRRVYADRQRADLEMSYREELEHRQMMGEVNRLLSRQPFLDAMDKIKKLIARAEAVAPADVPIDVGMVLDAEAARNEGHEAFRRACKPIADQLIRDPYWGHLGAWGRDQTGWFCGDLDGDGMIDHPYQPQEDWRAFVWAYACMRKSKAMPYMQQVRDRGASWVHRWMQLRIIWAGRPDYFDSVAYEPEPDGTPYNIEKFGRERFLKDCLRSQRVTSRDASYFSGVIEEYVREHGAIVVEKRNGDSDDS